MWGMYHFEIFIILQQISTTNILKEMRKMNTSLYYVTTYKVTNDYGFVNLNTIITSQSNFGKLMLGTIHGHELLYPGMNGGNHNFLPRA